MERYRYTNASGVPYYDAGGLRTKMEVFLPDSQDVSQWNSSAARYEEYAYDSDLDYLTSVYYSDTSTTRTWSYDAAGNRISDSGNQGTWNYDKLNRMLESPGFEYINDINGNRKWRNYAQSGVQRYVWDMIGRMTSACGASTGARYFYRADGMRIKKIDGLTINWVIDDEQTGSGHYDEITDVNMPTYRYYYDGQMCMEEDKTWGISQPPHGPNVEVTQYGIGARGIDYIYKKFKQAGSSTWNTTAEQFPLYDGHGNMVATLSRDGSSFVVNNKRTYDVWGGVRNETDLDNAPNTKYCANLGHKEDDESGLIYMRARYYEPWTGRFLSEDLKYQGINWYIYAYNSPTNHIDKSGEIAIPLPIISFVIVIIEGLISASTDVLIQMTAYNRSIEEVDWLSVGASAILGLLGGTTYHAYRTLFYMTKSAAHRRAWQAAGGDFATYFAKFIGAGTRTSLTRDHFSPLFRAMWLGGLGSFTMYLYGAFVLSFADDN
jgi:RHS repeat-associated protein